MLNAQFTDDFSDGDFTNNPEWIGETSKFRIEAEELQLYDLNDPPEANSWLSTISQSINEASWEFTVRFDFNPSSANYAEIYLVSNQQDLNENLNGYFVKLGNTTDEVSLYRNDGTTSTKIIDGTDGRLNTNLVNVRVRVTRNTSGIWTLENDTLGGTDYYTEGSVEDVNYLTSEYFGIKCIYTATRKDKIFFDDFITTGTAFVDNTPPELVGVNVVDSQTLRMLFNEPLEETTALNADNYIVNNGIDHPSELQFDNGDPQKVLLSFNSSFIIGTSYILQYQNLEDNAGNTITSGSISFSYYEAFSNMLVINEILADPTPVVNLPNSEFIELFNLQDYTINLSNWKLQVGSTVKDFPVSEIAPNGYAIICDANDIDLFSAYENVIGIAGMQTLTNGGTSIRIKSEDEIEIDAVNYSVDWYQDNIKEEGGWTLERIDPANTCGGITNWSASINSNGGTPGSINSIYAENIDTVAPKITEVQINGNNYLTIVFNENTDTITSYNVLNYSIEPELEHPVFISQNEENPLAINLFYSVSFSENTPYTLTVENISDACGNTLTHETHNFIIYHAIAYDIVITEIMADPAPVVQLPEAEYIELYNKTEYPIELTNWKLYVGNSDCELPYAIIEPYSYLTLVDENESFLFENTPNIIGVESMPSLTNSGTTIALKSKEGVYIHGVNYSDDWYNNSFKAEGGWSLEMIDVDNPCTGLNNWTACTDLRGGTPSAVNSVNDNNPDLSAPQIEDAEIVDADTVRIYFNEPLRENNLNYTSNYLLDHDIGNPIWVYAEPPLFNTVLLKFNTVFTQGEVYYISVADTIRDCSGNFIENNSIVAIANADSVQARDLLINEVLFNPYPNGSDFIEIYNPTEKVFDLKKLWISSRNDEGELYDANPIRSKSFLLLPQMYCAISVDPANIGTIYYTPYAENIALAEHIPSMPDDAGEVVLLDRYMQIIDEMHYTDDMQFELLTSKEGVSLERISLTEQTMNQNNWFSASESVGYATPGYQNSQFSMLTEISTNFALEFEIFSPDSDGIDDRLEIQYSLENPGGVASIAIYDSNGRFITWITENTSLNLNGVFYWDGLDSKNLRCPIGIYIVYIELYSATEASQIYKLPCVLSIKNY